METLEQIRAKIRRNFPQPTAQSAAKRQKLLWGHETLTTQVTLCNRYRLAKVLDEDSKLPGYLVWTVASPNLAPKVIGGPYSSAKEAKEAADAHCRGDPIQQKLSQQEHAHGEENG